MKKYLPWLGSLLLAACTTLPRAVQAPAPDDSMASRAGVRLQTLRRGHAVYLAHCGRCHELVLPREVSREDWHVVVPGMAWNAGISKADEAALRAYLVAAKG